MGSPAQSDGAVKQASERTKVVFSRTLRGNGDAHKPMTVIPAQPCLPLVQMPSPYGKDSACALQIVGVSCILRSYHGLPYCHQEAGIGTATVDHVSISRKQSETCR